MSNSSRHPSWEGASGFPTALMFILGLLILLAAILPYRDAVRNGFTYDAVVAVEQNPRIQGVSQLGTIFSTEYWNQSYLESRLYRPVTLASFAFDYELWGLSPARFHATNLLLHVLTSLLVAYLIFRILGRTRGGGPEARGPGVLVWAAGLSGILFAVHPLHSESVLALVGRADILAALFSVCVLLCLFSWGRTRWFAPLFLALGLLSKESAALVLCLVAAFHLFGILPGTDPSRASEDQAPRQSPLLARGKALLGSFLLLLPGILVAGVPRYLVLRDIPRPSLHFVDNPMVILGPLDRLATASVVFLKYLRLFFWPDPLSPDYGYNAIPVSTLSYPPAIFGLGLIVASALCVGLILWRSARPSAGGAVDAPPNLATIAGLGLAWFVGCTLVSGNFFFLISTLVAERLAYLPDIGLILVLAAGTTAIAERASVGRSRTVVTGAVTTLVAVAAVLSVSQGRARTAAWHDNDTLFTAAVQDQPNSHRVWAELGRIRMSEGRLEEALPLLLHSRDIFDGWYKTHDRLLSVYMDLGKPDSALVAARALRRLDPTNVKAHYVFARDHQSRGEWREALAETRVGLEIQPGYLPLLLAQAEIQEASGDRQAAIESYRSLLELAPETVGIHAKIGPLLIAESRWEEAAASYRLLAGQSPDWQSYNYLAWSLLQAAEGTSDQAGRAERLGEAIDAARQSIDLAPEEMKAYPEDTLARALWARGDRDEAIAIAWALGEKNPGDPAVKELLELVGRDSRRR